MNKFIERIVSKDRLELPVGGTGDAVQITTIHQAKGLEFPVVILTDLSHQFNMTDLRGNILFDREYGFGCKVLHQTTPTRYPSASFRVVERLIKTKQLEEELRKLYVAMTRARERLILIGTCKDSDICSKHRFSARGDSFHIHNRENAVNFNDWLIPVLLESNDFVESFSTDNSIACSGNGFGAYFLAQTFTPRCVDEMLDARKAELLDQREVMLGASKSTSEGNSAKMDLTEDVCLPNTVAFQYPYRYATSIRAKVSATTLAHMDDPEGESVTKSQLRSSFKLPKIEFDQTSKAESSLDADSAHGVREKRITSESIKRGIVTHSFLQSLPLGKGERVDIAKELTKFIELKLIKPEDADLISTAAISALFESEIGSRLCGVGKAHKEWRFIARADIGDLVSYNRVYRLLILDSSTASFIDKELVNEDGIGELGMINVDNDDFVLLQGIVDLIFEDEKGRLIIDWKTDNVSIEDVNERTERYMLQMWAYKHAVTMAYGSVDATMLGFITPSRFVDVKLDN